MRWWTLAIPLLAVAAACTAAPTPTATPSLSPTSAPTDTPSATATVTPAPSLTPTAPPANDGPNTPPQFLTENPPDAELLGPLTEDEESKIDFTFGEWRNTDFGKRTVSLTEVKFLGLYRDQIAPIYSPRFDSISEADEYLEALEPVLAVEINGDARAYPLQILIWHEVVNDEVGGVPVAPTY